MNVPQQIPASMVVAGLARVQTVASCLNSGEFSYRGDFWAQASVKGKR